MMRCRVSVQTKRRAERRNRACNQSFADCRDGKPRRKAKTFTPRAFRIEGVAPGQKKVAGSIRHDATRGKRGKGRREIDAAGIARSRWFFLVFRCDELFSFFLEGRGGRERGRQSNSEITTARVVESASIVHRCRYASRSAYILQGFPMKIQFGRD